MVCLHISISLAAVCECLRVYLYFFYWPVFVSFFLSVFVVSCLSCTLFVDLLVCRSASAFVLASQKNKIPCQRKSLWQADGFEILLMTLRCSSILLTFHIYSISTYSVRAAFLPCILFGLVSERGGKEQPFQQPLNSIHGCCCLIKEKQTRERWASNRGHRIKLTSGGSSA